MDVCKLPFVILLDMNQQTRIINCPQCGNQLPLSFRYSRLTVCTHCDSTLFLEGDDIKLAGKQAVLSDIPSLLKLGSPFQYQKTAFTPVGKVRYRYDLGFWEEWWAVDNSGHGFWISVDEGDFAFEKPLDIEASKLPTPDQVQLGNRVHLYDIDWQVTETGEGICEGYAGELPEIIQVNEPIPYAHLSDTQGQLLTLEYYKHTTRAYKGEWVDPFEIKSAL